MLARLILCAFLVSLTSSAATFTLYDPSAGTLPTAQGWTFLGLGLPPGTPSFVGGATNLDSSASPLAQAGFFQSAPAPLDRSTGYALRFRVEIVSEATTRPERAGFSVILVSQDVASGVASSIEIGFQNNRVFAQPGPPNLFGNPPAAEAAFNPVGVGFIDFELAVLGGAFQLFADGSSVLGGALQDYTSFAGLFDPYESASFIFLGDDTTSAGAEINLGLTTLETDAALLTPEPTTLSLTLGALTLAAAIRRRRGRGY